MKPQCTTAAQCLKELARVMEQFMFNKITDAMRSRYCIDMSSAWDKEAVPKFLNPENWKFAIAEVEGKPVFPGDTLYDMHGAITAGIWCKINPEGFSWNPPKPNTVMVEMLREDVEYWGELSKTADYSFAKSEYMQKSKRFSDACRKTLKESE